MQTAGGSVVVPIAPATPRVAIHPSDVSFYRAVRPRLREPPRLNGRESYIIRALFTAEDP
jgi:hypothetical protein